MDDKQGICLKQDSSYLFRVLKNEDEDSVKALIKRVFSGFLDGDYWEWKYKRNPDFDSSLVVVAERNVKKNGC